MHAGFFGWGGTPSVWGSFLEGRDKIFLLGEALKFVVIFQNFAVKLFKTWKVWKNSRKNAKFLRKVAFFEHAVWKIRNII